MPMRAYRSYYLALKPDDFRQAAAELVARDPTAIVYVAPANDNTPVKLRLVACVVAWLLRLIGKGNRVARLPTPDSVDGP
jgi:hypothetical protein